MTVALVRVRTNATTIDPVTVFRARCEARAYLYAAGELELHDAVDVQAGGLCEAIGQDVIQAILAQAFQPVRAREWCVIERAAIADDRSRADTPASTVEAFLFELRRGLSCLADPRNRDRLRCCDPNAMREIATRLHSWRDHQVEWLPAWADNDIATLIDVWEALREAAV